MRLAELFPQAPPAAGNLEIQDLAYDSGDVRPGTLFFCVPGFTRDGHEFADEAIRKGAAALVVQRALGTTVPEVEVPSVRAAMAPAAARFYGDPTRELEVIGITGTNGKTTAAFLTRRMLEAAGRSTGLLGTVKSVIGGHEYSVERTTPEAIDLQRIFTMMLDAGDRAAVMEVSSHALELHRADAIHFEVAVFTNLTQDHLDFHPTMEEYFAAKRRLFVELGPSQAVVNLDDSYGKRLAAELPSAITYAIGGDATYSAHDLKTAVDGSTFSVSTPEGEIAVRSSLRGTFNVYNALAALAAARAVGVPQALAVGTLADAGQVPGRFEVVDEGQPFAVVVDYAHTPDSLENVLVTARELANGRRLHVVFGCGGDRDRAKRPLMGEVASRNADRIVVTSDNPRSEPPGAIIDEILAGAGPGAVAIVDRREAIEDGLAHAGPGDIVVVAGKGHEQGQEFERGRKIPFHDVSVVRELLRATQAGRSAPAKSPAP